jgi:hypothetical protein
VSLAAVAAVAVAAGAALVAPPPPGPKGLEGVPIPKAPVLAEPQRLHLGQSIDGIKCQRVEKVAFHTHAHLAIFVNGKQRQVPYGIGIGPPLLGTNTSVGPFVNEGSCFAWLHTHTADGIIHMEAPRKRSFTLGEFFDIWGQPLSTARVGPARGKVTVLVDGKARAGNPRTVSLRNHELIQLDVGAPRVAEQVVGFAKL